MTVADFTALDLVILALASYRITRVLVVDTVLGVYPGTDDDHPRGTFVRGWLDRRFYDANGHDRGAVRGWAGKLLSCSWCLGVWVSLALWWAYAHSGWGWVDEVCVVAAIAGAQGYIASRLNA